MTSLRLASTPRFVGPDGRESPLAARDAVLLAWLAVRGPTTRQQLAGLLWPDRDTDLARNQLRQRLFNLRRQVGVTLVEGTGTLALAANVAHDLDEAPTLLGQAEYDYSEELAAWLAEERRRRAAGRAIALERVAEQAEAGGDLRLALAHAQDLLACDPNAESAHRRVMRLHYLAGDRASALQAFERCARMLMQELGIGPAKETLQLVETIRRAESTPGTAVLQPLPASVLLPPRLIGRDAELASLQQGWAAGQVVAVIGEAGLGKTRLVQAFSQVTTGIVGAAGRPGDAGVPFATLARLLRAVVQHADEARAGDPVLPAATRSAIARVLPELDPAPPAAGEGQRMLMQHALRSFLDGQGGLAGLWVDDLHFADEASLEMLRALIDEDVAPRDGRTPLRWVLGYRPAESGSAVQALHDALVESARLLPVPLRPLDEAALAELVDSLGLPGVSGAALAKGLARRTGGNPLFVLETLKQAWVERKLSQLADESALPRPVSVGRLIERRLTQLSPGALALARVASVAGSDFSVAMAEHVLQATAMQFADAINELESAQVMRGNAFAHDLVYDAVRASVPASVAAHTHESIAAWLEPRGAEPANVAQHWILAGQPRRALPWLERAADKARAALRYKEYIAFMERKSAIHEAAGERAEAFAALLVAADEFVNTDRNRAGGEQWCERLLRLAESPEERIRALLHRSTFEREVVGPGQGAASAREALAESTRLGEPSLIALSQQTLATALYIGDQLAEAARYFEACMGWFDAHGSGEERSELHGNLAQLYDNLGRLDEALPQHELAFKLAHEGGNQSNAIVVLGNLACNRIDAGKVDDAAAYLRRSLQLMALYDDFGATRGSHHAMLSLCLCQAGHYDKALEHSMLGQELMGDYVPSLLPLGILREAQIWRHLGQWARMQRVLGRAEVRDADRIAVKVMAAQLQRYLSSARGQPAPSLSQALALLPESERPDLRLPLLIEQAPELPPDQGLAQIEDVIARAARLQHAGTVLAGHVHAAELAIAVDSTRAARHAHAALGLLPEVTSVMLLPAEAWLRCSRALQANGETMLAHEVVAKGQEWIEATLRHVPSEFRDSFLHRNPVNRDLMQMTARRSRSG